MKKGFHWVLLVLNGLFSAGLGILILGGLFGVNSLIWILTGAFLFGVSGIYLWLKLSANNKPGRNLLILIQAGLVVFFIITGLIQSIVFTNHPMVSTDREKGFKQLWAAIHLAYPYFEEKGIDWDSVYAKYEPQIVEANTDGEFYTIISCMMAELEDGHSQLQVPVIGPSLYGTVKSIGGVAVIDQVGYSAQMAGVKPGMVLTAVNGIRLETYLDDMPIGYDNAATKWAVQVRKMEMILSVPEDESPLNITVINSDGEELNFVITRLTPPDDYNPDIPSETKKAIEWKLLEEDYGYIQVNRLWNREGEDLVADFDLALEELFDTKGLVLDLRENGGGNSIFGDQIAGRFLTSAFIYGKEWYPVRLYSHGWRKTTSYTARPRGNTYQGDVVVLTDYYTMSSAEWLVGALKDSGRAITLGRATSGSTGNPIRFFLPGGGNVRYSTGSFTRPDGSLVEGFGYEPDIEVNWTTAAVISGVDMDINQALDWLIQGE